MLAEMSAGCRAPRWRKTFAALCVADQVTGSFAGEADRFRTNPQGWTPAVFFQNDIVAGRRHDVRRVWWAHQGLPSPYEMPSHFYGGSMQPTASACSAA